MSALVYGTASELARLTTMIGAVPLLAPTFHLFENNITPLSTSLIGDFVEATFSGYAAVAAPFLAPGLDPNNNPVAPVQCVYITDGITPGVAYGVYILDSAGHLVAASKFDNAPYNFAVAGDQLVFTILFGLDLGTVTVSIGP
jgi:hypothetical protein